MGGELEMGEGDGLGVDFAGAGGVEVGRGCG